MFGWQGNMKRGYVIAAAVVLSVIVLTGCSDLKATYYEIPKSEVVDVSGAKKGNTDQSKKNERIETKTSQEFTYKNERFGFSIYVPDFLKPGYESEIEDGMYFENTEGDTYLSVYGSHYPGNYYHDPSLEDIYSEFLANMIYTPSFVDKGYNWYQVKWQEYNTVYVKKYYLKSDNTDNDLTISYPLSKEKEYEDVVEKIIDSFTPGVGYESACEE